MAVISALAQPQAIRYSRTSDLSRASAKPEKRLVTPGDGPRSALPGLGCDKAIHPCGARAHHGEREILDVSPQP